MAKNRFIILEFTSLGCVVLLTTLLYGCSFRVISKPKEIIQKTWEQLSPADKQEISSLEGATVQTVETLSLSLERYHFKNPNNDAQLYLVTFPSDHRMILGDVERLVDMRSGEILGVSLRD